MCKHTDISKGSHCHKMHAIRKQVNHNAATLCSCGSCSPALQQTIAAPTHVHPNAPASLVKGKRNPLSPSSAREPGPASGGILQGQVCLKGWQRALESAPVPKALSRGPPEPSSHISCNGPKESSPKGNTSPCSLPSAPRGGAAI